jgi:hypothetical protein
MGAVEDADFDELRAVTHATSARGGDEIRRLNHGRSAIYSWCASAT